MKPFEIHKVHWESHDFWDDDTHGDPLSVADSETTSDDLRGLALYTCRLRKRDTAVEVAFRLLEPVVATAESPDTSIPQWAEEAVEVIASLGSPQAHQKLATAVKKSRSLMIAAALRLGMHGSRYAEELLLRTATAAGAEPLLRSRAAAMLLNGYGRREGLLSLAPGLSSLSESSFGVAFDALAQVDPHLRKEWYLELVVEALGRQSIPDSRAQLALLMAHSPHLGAVATQVLLDLLEDRSPAGIRMSRRRLRGEVRHFATLALLSHTEAKSAVSLARWWKVPGVRTLFLWRAKRVGQ